MKKLLFTLIALLVFTNGFSQILDPVKWKSRTEKISDSEYKLTIINKNNQKDIKIYKLNDSDKILLIDIFNTLK